jgi:hypothetical protein
MNDLTITDVLSGREELSAQFTITSDQRLYYN